MSPAVIAEGCGFWAGAQNVYRKQRPQSKFILRLENDRHDEVSAVSAGSAAPRSG